MDVSLIQMPKEEAKAKLDAYRKRLAKMRFGQANKEVNEEYKAAAKAYELLAEGTVLLDLDDVFRDCLMDEKFRPKLAIARADRKQVRFRRNGTQGGGMFDSSLGYPGNNLQIRVNLSPLPQEVNPWRSEGYAIVPMVPLDVRPEVGQLKDWFILWEVEQWADQRITSRPDRDPYLLKHVGGPIYAVLAEWDLTDLERSIMKRRVS